MRERSGRSGRRRGSQKLGTASGSFAGTDAFARGDCAAAGGRSRRWLSVRDGCEQGEHRDARYRQPVQTRRHATPFAAEHSTRFRAGQTYYRLCSGEMFLQSRGQGFEQGLVQLSRTACGSGALCASAKRAPSARDDAHHHDLSSPARQLRDQVFHQLFEDLASLGARQSVTRAGAARGRPNERRDEGASVPAHGCAGFPALRHQHQPGFCLRIAGIFKTSA